MRFEHQVDAVVEPHVEVGHVIVELTVVQVRDREAEALVLTTASADPALLRGGR